MNKETKNPSTAEPVFIPDECGDTLWDEVLQPEVNTCQVKPITDKADKK